jgi:hypothetical protein
VSRTVRYFLLSGHLSCDVYGTSAERSFTLVIGSVTYLRLRGHLRLCTSVGVSGAWIPRGETSCYSISRSLQVPASEATAVGISGSWFLRRETSSYSTRSLQSQVRRLEATAVGVSGSWFLRRETKSYKAGENWRGQAGHNIV